MEIRRILIYLAIAIVGVLLWNAWMHDYPPEGVKTETQQQSQPNVATNIPTTEQPSTQITKAGEFVPTTFKPTSAPVVEQVAEQNKPVTPAVTTGKLIKVKTDVLNLAIDLASGNIISANLPKYPESVKTPHVPVQILNNNPAELYMVQSGLTSSTSGAAQAIQYTADKDVYTLDDNANTLTVVLKGKTNKGLTIVKTYTFQRGLYAINEDLQITNATNKTWSGSLFNQIVRRNVPTHSTGFHAQSYDYAAMSSPEKPYQKLTYKMLDDVNINRTSHDGWIAMQQQYFLTALVPDKTQLNRYYSHVAPDAIHPGKNNVYTVGYVGAQINLNPAQVSNNHSILYIGPEIARQLTALAPGLDLTIDYGWLWPISKLLFWIMEQIHKVVSNWGWTIILVTLLIKIVFYPFSDKSYKSMAKMRDLQPRIQALKERFGDDRQGFSKAMMELYKKEKVNPMGGCLPMIIQVPVFIALYYVLIESVELRQAPFMLWIQDLSAKDPYYILPALMGLSMVVQQKLSPPPPDPMQARVMMLLPVIFTVFLISFPAGLVLYWLTNNILSILQQWYVMKTHHAKTRVYTKKVRQQNDG